MTPSVLYRRSAAAAHALEPALAAGWRWAERAMARDVTEATTGRSCLVVAPHPDDETIGCGATIARKRAAGTQVDVVIVADGRYAQSQSRQVTPRQLAAIRRDEVIAACGALGVEPDHVTQLGHEDTRVDAVEDMVADQLRSHLDRCQPDEVLIVSGLDHHPDHRAVHRAALRALTQSGGRPVVWEYPVWSWIDGPWLDQRDRSPWGRAAHLVTQPMAVLARGRAMTVAVGAYGEAKKRALAEHASQTSAYTDEEEWAIMDEQLLSVFSPTAELFLPLSPWRGGPC